MFNTSYVLNKRGGGADFFFNICNKRGKVLIKVGIGESVKGTRVAKLLNGIVSISTEIGKHSSTEVGKPSH